MVDQQTGMLYAAQEDVGIWAFEHGLFVSHDGENTDLVTGAPEGTNFKYVAWSAIASTPGLQAYLDTPAGCVPRQVAAVPEPGTGPLLVGGLGALAAVGRRRSSR